MVLFVKNRCFPCLGTVIMERSCHVWHTSLYLSPYYIIIIIIIMEHTQKNDGQNKQNEELNAVLKNEH
jgi:hypothetical protein